MGSKTQTTEPRCEQCGSEVEPATSMATLEEEPYCWSCGEFVEVVQR